MAGGNRVNGDQTTTLIWAIVFLVLGIDLLIDWVYRSPEATDITWRLFLRKIHCVVAMMSFLAAIGGLALRDFKGACSNLLLASTALTDDIPFRITLSAVATCLRGE